MWNTDIEIFNIETVSSDFTPCITAIKNGNVDALKVLLELDADPNKRFYQFDRDVHECDGYRIISYPIIFAVIEGNLEMVELLYKHGANLNVFLEEEEWNSYTKTIHKRSALSCAIDYRNQEVCDFLIEHGIEDNDTTEEIDLMCKRRSRIFTSI